MQLESNTLEILTLFFTIITTLCALYISYVALKHSVRPKVNIDLMNKGKLVCGKTSILKFKVLNKGYWYAKPFVSSLNVYCNFDRNFQLKKIYYGSVQQIKDNEVKSGTGNMNYLSAIGLNLGPGKEGEEIHVKLIAPNRPGVYQIRVSAYSENGVSFRKYFGIKISQN